MHILYFDVDVAMKINSCLVPLKSANKKRARQKLFFFSNIAAESV